MSEPSEPEPTGASRVLRLGPATLLAAAALAFLMPFGSVACEEERVTFTGLDVATWRVHETVASGLALAALLLAVGGVGSALAWNRGGGFALGAILAMLGLLGRKIVSLADVRVEYGYAVALWCLCAAGMLRLVARRSARGVPQPSPEPEPAAPA